MRRKMNRTRAELKKKTVKALGLWYDAEYLVKKLWDEIEVARDKSFKENDGTFKAFHKACEAWDEAENVSREAHYSWQKAKQELKQFDEANK